MDDMIEIVDFDFNDNGGSNKSSNFGGGLELLMNDKNKDNNSSRPHSDINLDDLNNLENELNGLVDDSSSYNSYKPKSDLFSKPSVSFDETMNTDTNSNINYYYNGSTSTSNLGQSTSQTESDNKTWDGYGKFNNIPMNPDKTVPLESKMTKEEMLREKFKYLRKLEALEKKGVEMSKKYTMESSLLEMQGEYETIMDEKTKQNSVKFQGNMLMAMINGIEFLNGRFDPFDIKLDGWSEQVQENITDYDDIFAELFDKYKSKATMAPELKLLFQLGGSAMMVHMTNTMFKSSMPGMDDILLQNPDLMRSFQTAAVNSMAQTSPGFSGFMGNMMGPNINQGPPPPMATQGPNSIPPPYGRPGNNNYSNMNMNTNMNSNIDDGISLRENFKPSSNNSTNSFRPEMKGPSDISDILSGLKTKTINIQDSSNKQFQNRNDNTYDNTADNSTISIGDLKDLQNSGNMPKNSSRRKKSASNTVSLDI